jgi:hypothetical protein
VNGWEVVGTFFGIPVAVLFLIAVPIFGPVWWHRLRGRHDPDAGDRSRRDTPPAAPGPP